ncbi:hypothetical protein MNEG_8527 [Monoraphidium neglectum]|uniref:Uncharacterized protein n=1 Tax=Monoraphidium neglectum TaxID=145388 RepID=A0A0D2MFD9_9CHLO|nr:hypothetical protein MNEG_8527 [Monoraphidium neglectum]KIY99436.1 hypothetical protein MNEG_8527 [Monoraphidium neglectum]|eukprot:XP_013898456.1 hypothetical protein MNEG_8527 [Monoraphidium neglectum]
MNVIKGDAVMRQYLTTPNQTLTAFPTSDKNDTFIQSIFRFMIVPGKAWTAAELYEAAPISLKTL